MNENTPRMKGINLMSISHSPLYLKNTENRLMFTPSERNSAYTPPIKKNSDYYIYPNNKDLVFQNQILQLEKKTGELLVENEKLNNYMREKAKENELTTKRNFYNRNYSKIRENEEKNEFLLKENKRLNLILNDKTKEIQSMKKLCEKSDLLIDENDKLIEEVEYWRNRYFYSNNLKDNNNKLNEIIQVILFIINSFFK